MKTVHAARLSATELLRFAPRSAVSPGTRAAGLDGLRGLALLAVLVYHADVRVLPGGFLGVEMFFVLSGFLLTALMLDEHRREGIIDWIAYMGRRARRVVPALFVLLSVLAVAGSLLAPDIAHRLARDVGWSLAGLTNWHLAGEGTSYLAQVGRPPLVRHLWSIAVELQAYLLLPFVAAFAARHSRRIAVAMLATGIAGSAAAMGVLFRTEGPARAYYGTDTRIGALLTGALLATLLGGGEREGARLTPRRLDALAVGSLGVLGVLFVGAGEETGLLYPGGFLAAQAATVVLLVAALRGGAARHAFTWGPLRWLGERSYGIYLWHWPIVVLWRPGIDVGLPPALLAALGAVGAFVAGELSFRIVERPFMRREVARRFTRPHVRAAGVAGFATVAMTVVALLVQAAPPDPIAESLREGERALAEQRRRVATAAEPAPSVPPPVVVAPRAAAASAVAAQPPLPPPPPPPPPAAAPVVAVGDSVMLGAVPQLQGRLGPQGWIDASKSRQVKEGIDVVRRLRDEGRIERVLVVHLGNNGPVKPEDVDRLVEASGEAEHVLFVTVRVHKAWQDSVNTTLREGVERHPKAQLVDWHGASAGHREWFYSDGTHLSASGREAYADLVAGAVPPEPTPTPPPPPPPPPPPDPAPTPTPTPGLLPLPQPDGA